MRGHLLSSLKCTSIHHVGRNSRGSHGMIADRSSQLRIPSPAFDHAESILSQHPVFGQVASSIQRPK